MSKEYWSSLARTGASCTLLFLSVACGSAEPEDVVDEWLTALETGQTDRAMELISSEDRKYEAWEEYSNWRYLVPISPGRSSHVVVGSRVEGESAEVDVKFQTPDTTPIDDELVEIIIRAENSEIALAEGLELIAKSDLPMKEEDRTLRLVREDGDWRMDLDWSEVGRRLEERESYVSSISLDASISEVTGWSNDWAVTGTITNQGDRIVDDVFIRLAIRTTDGGIDEEFGCHQVFEILEPQQTQEVFCRIGPWPAAWDRTEYSVSVESVDFEDEEERAERLEAGE